VLTLVFLPALYAIWFKIKSDRQLVSVTTGVAVEMERTWAGRDSGRARESQETYVAGTPYRKEFGCSI
jgi:hypothetical protein